MRAAAGYGHLPMILNEDGHKMSKRRDAVSVVDYEGRAFCPEALLNYLARLGWGHGDEEFSIWTSLSNGSAWKRSARRPAASIRKNSSG